MSEALKRLVRLFGQPQHDYRASTLQFLEVNTEKVKRELELDERGARNGSREEPAADAGELDSVEREILAKVEGYASAAQQIYSDNMESYERRLQGLGVDALVAEIRTSFSNAKSNFLALVQTGRGELQTLREEVLDVERSYKMFRRKHNLDRPAHYPSSRILYYGIIAVILIAESILNGVMLARGDELGLLGGVGSALMIAVINVVMLGYGLGGNALRLSHHRRSAICTSGILLALLSLAIVATFNLLVAHYRDALAGAEPTQAGLMAIQTFQNDPSAIADAQSWFLFLLGCSFAAAGALDRLKIDDPYPGYGKLARQRVQIREDFEAEKADVIERLREERDDCVNTATQARREIDKRIQETESILTARQSQNQAYKTHRRHLEKVANDLLTVYREANAGIRKTKVPAHFRRNWSIDDVEAQIIVPREFDIARTRDAARHATEALETAVKEVNEAFERALKSYEEIERQAMKEAEHGKNTPAAA